MLESGEGTTSGAADQARPVVTWEIAPLRAAALRTERAVNQRWQTLRAAIIGGALLLGVIGSAAALSLSGFSSLPGGMGFLSANAASSAEQEVTAREARDGVAQGDPSTPPTDPAPPPADETSSASTPSDAAPAAAPEPVRGTPTAEPQPEPTVPPEPEPTPEPSPSTPPDETEVDEQGEGLIGGLLDILLPGLLP